MSNNTQAQGRTLFTERAFAFTPKGASNGWGSTNDPSRVGDDPLRALARWEIELYRQLYAGDVTHDPVAKQAAMDAANAPAPAPAPAPTPSPSPSPAPTPPAPAPSPTPSPAPAPTQP